MIQTLLKKQLGRLNPKQQLNLGIRGFSLIRLPLLAFCWPKVITITQRRSEVLIPLNRRTQNHLGVMYFGALAIGAELVVSLHVLDEIREKGMIEFIFKDFHADFLKRAAGDVTFVCEEGFDIRELVRKARGSGQRESGVFKAFALTEKQSGLDPVAQFSLTLCVKQKTSIESIAKDPA